MVLALLCTAQFVIVLDATIVAIALPALGADLGLGTTELGWVITAYTVVFGGCLLAVRAAGRPRRAAPRVRLGPRRLRRGLAGLRPRPGGGVLLAGRAVQGLGAALVAPAALALLTAARPDGPERVRALGWWTAAAAGGGASGWVLGGMLSGLLDWRWVFLVNVPVCAAAAALAPRVLTERPCARARAAPTSPARSSPPRRSPRSCSRSPLAGEHGPGASGDARRPGRGRRARRRARAASSARAPDPLFGRALLRRPGVAAPNAVAAVLTASTTPPMFLCTLYAQDVLGLAPARGRPPVPAVQPRRRRRLVGRSAGRGPRWGSRVRWPPGCAAVAAGALALLAIAPGAPALPSLAAGFVLLGAGLGVASVASTALGTAAADGSDQGLSSGLLTTSAQVGTALGLAVVIPLAAARSAALGGGPGAQVAGYEAGFVIAAAVAGVAAAAVAAGARHRAPSRRAAALR